MVGKPRLTALRFAADRVAHEHALVGVTLLLHDLPVLAASARTKRRRAVRTGAFHAEVELRQSRELGEIDSRPVGGTARRTNGRNIVMGDGICVKRQMMPDEG